MQPIFIRVPDYIRQRYMSWKSDTVFGRKEWMNRAVKSEGYYYNDMDYTASTFTASQFEKIREVTNIPVSINYLYPVCNQKLALLAQTKPSMRTLSMDGRAKNHAAVLDKMKEAVLYNSNYPLESEAMIKDMLISGMGHLMVAPTSIYQSGLFNIALTNVPYDEVILDINAKKRNLEDMEGFFLERVFTLAKVMQLYGDIISQLVGPDGEPVNILSLTSTVWVENEVTDKQNITTPMYDQANRMIVREFYEKIFTTMYAVPDPNTGDMVYLFAENLDPASQSILTTAKSTFPGIYIKKNLMMGDYIVHIEVLPITQWPLKTIFFEWGGRPYRSYGMIHFTKDMQAAFDKLLQIMLLNGILSNNAGWNAPKGAISEEDRKKWEDYGNNPRVIKEYIPIERGTEVLKPERDQVSQLSNFYPMVLEMLKSGIEYSTGINAILQGNAQDAGVDVFSSLQQYQNAAMMRIILATSHINQMLTEVGQVLIEYLTANITPDTYQFFDEKGALNELVIAKQIANDIKSFRYLTISIPQQYMPSQRLAVSSELMKIAQSSPDPTARSLYTQTAIDMTEIPGFDNLKEQLDVVKNTESKLNDLQNAYNRLMETSKQMENKYINSQLEVQIMKELIGKSQLITQSYTELQTKLSIASDLLTKDNQNQQPSGTAQQ